MPPSRGRGAGRAILDRAVVYIPDVRGRPEYRLQEPGADAVGFRSVLSVPMLRDGSPIGAISVIGAEPAMFSERQIAMLQTFADQAVIAIENTRLFNELQTRNRDLTECAGAADGDQRDPAGDQPVARDVQPVFETIAANAREAVRGRASASSTRSTASCSTSRPATASAPKLEAFVELHPDRAEPRQRRRPRRS